MRQKVLRYDVKLTGFEKLETYTEALLAHPAFSDTRIAQGEESIYEVYGPNKAAVRKNEDDIRSDLSERSEKLRITVPGLVEKVTSDIVSTQEGEKIALERPMHVVFQQYQGKSPAHVTFDMEL